MGSRWGHLQVYSWFQKVVNDVNSQNNHKDSENKIKEQDENWSIILDNLKDRRFRAAYLPVMDEIQFKEIGFRFENNINKLVDACKRITNPSNINISTTNTDMKRKCNKPMGLSL